MTTQDCPLSIKWPNRGDYQCPRRVTGFRIDTGYLTSTDEFTIDVYDEDPVRLRSLLWEPVELSVDGCPQLIGRVDSVERGKSAPNYATIIGRDYISDLVEGHVDPTTKIAADQALPEAIKLICSPYGITSVVASEEAKMRNARTGVNVNTGKTSPDIAGLKLKDVVPKVGSNDTGQGCYEFANAIAGHHGLTIQPGRTRSELVLSEPNYDQTPSLSVWRSDRKGNIASGSSVENGSKTPTYVLSSGEQGEAGKSAKPIAANFGLNTVAPFSQLSGSYAVTDRRLPGKGGAIEFGKLYRLFYFKDRDAKTQAQLERGLARALADRIKELLVYHATLIGHKDAQTKAIPTVDTTVQVDDDWCDVHEQLWIARRTLRWRSGVEDAVDLECWKLGSVTL